MKRFFIDFGLIAVFLGLLVLPMSTIGLVHMGGESPEVLSVSSEAEEELLTEEAFESTGSTKPETQIILEEGR